MSQESGPWIAEASSLVRMGLKGPRAADWLMEAKISVPAQPNSWQPTNPANSWDVIARLGSTEFFLEEDASNPRIATLIDELGVGAPHVYPVLREDRALVLGGHGVESSVLAQVCNVDFAGLDLASNPVVMTLMIGVAVLVVPQAHEPARRYRIWCDPSFGQYLWSTLEHIVGEAGGERLDIGELRGGPRLNNERKRQ
jgi:sarcosine oxidase, subunit gamma